MNFIVVLILKYIYNIVILFLNRFYSQDELSPSKKLKE